MMKYLKNQLIQDYLVVLSKIGLLLYSRVVLFTEISVGLLIKI